MAHSVRVSGLVLDVQTRSGVARASGNAYSITTARVLVGDAGTADVTLPDHVRTAKGEIVDWSVDVDVYQGRPDLRVNGEFSDRLIAAGTGA